MELTHCNARLVVGHFTNLLLQLPLLCLKVSHQTGNVLLRKDEKHNAPMHFAACLLSLLPPCENNRDILIPAFVFCSVFLMQTDYKRKFNCVLENPITAETMNPHYIYWSWFHIIFLSTEATNMFVGFTKTNVNPCIGFIFNVQIQIFFNVL